MRKIFLLLSWIWCTCSVHGQEFNAHWIAMEDADSTSHVWFRNTYVSAGKPKEAFLHIMTTGYFKLYVNECNVGTAMFYLPPSQPDDIRFAFTFDISSYLMNDTTVIALLYSPVYPQKKDQQIAVNYYGTDAYGKPFAYHSDENWLCRRANSALMTDGNELVDGRYHDPQWKANNYATALWVNARRFNLRPHQANIPYAQGHRAVWTTRRRGYAYFDRNDREVVYSFPEGFIGQVRVTLREARKGQRMNIGGVQYICSGSTDEQACSVFGLKNFRKIMIEGDKNFDNSQIMNIEAIETAEKELQEWAY